MRKPILGILTASLALAVAMPTGAQKKLTVKTQKQGTEQASPAKPGDARAINSPTLTVPSSQGRADVKSIPSADKPLDSPTSKAPAKFADGDTYFNDFSDQGASMTIIDVDGNGKKWAYHSSGAMRVVYDSNVDMDDWMITQGIQLQAGKFYEISFSAWAQSSSYAEQLEVKLGKAASVDAMTISVLPQTGIKNEEARTYSKLISVPETGTYYIGVHAMSPKDTYAVYCDNLRVGPAITSSTPAEVQNLTITPIGTEGKATVSCKAPDKNLGGGTLSSLTKVEFWRDVTPIKTIENPAPGQEISFVDECGAGTYTWKAVASNADGSSTAVTVNATVVGPQGIPYLKSFPTANSLDDMTILDADNDGESWTWDKYQKYARLSAPQTGSHDWIITPPLILKAGKVYEYSSLISAGNPTAFPPMVKICLGTAPTAEAMTQEIVPVTTINKYDTYFTKEFTVPVDGLYHIGVYGCSETYLALIKLMNINVIGGAEAEGPAKVSDAVVEPDWSGRTKNAYISFRAPTKTGTDKPLAAITKIDIMRQGIVVHTFDNPAPGAALSWTDPVGEDGEYVYRIVPYNIVGQGGVTESVIKIGVAGKSVPYTENFKTDAFDTEFTIIDNNNDGTTFWHANATDPAYAWIHFDGKDTSTADDYLITPGIQLEQNTRYKISADAWGYNEGFRLLIGSAPKVDSLSNQIVPLTILPEALENFNGEFTAPYTGKYYVAVHANTAAGKRVTDFHATNIRVDRIGALNCPAAVEDFTVLADPNGEPKMTFRFKAPAKNMDGTALSVVSKIEIARAGSVVKTFENPTPGAALEYQDTPETEGEYAYTICPFSENGAGVITDYLGYAGLDVPATPQNIVATYIGNGKVKVVWDAVTTTAHGAQIPTPPTYVVLETDGSNEQQLGQTTKCEYTYTAVEGDGVQKRLFYGIFPFNSKGQQGQYGLSGNVFAGEAYPLTFLESFENGAPKSPIVIENIVFEPAWALCNDASFSNVVSSDGDNGFVAQEGYVNNSGRLYTGKISLKNTVSPTFSFYAYNINPEDYTNEIAVEIKEVGTENWIRLYNAPIRQAVLALGWGRISVDLSAWKGKEVHIAFIPTVNYCDDSHASYYKWTILDGLRVHNLTDNDLGANISASATNVNSGDDVEITVTVSNNGENAASAYRVDLYKNNKVVDSLNGTNLASGRVEKINFSQSLGVADPDEVEFYATVVYNGDENTNDNTSKTIKVSVNKPIYPTVQNLTAYELSESRGTVKMTWSVPSMDNVPPTPYKETFETAESWNKTGVCGWTFVDMDDAFIGGFQQFVFPGFTNDGTTKASFFVVDKTASELGQFASLFVGNSNSVKSLGSLLSWGGTPDDWAISPELYGGPQIVSFFAKNLQDNMPEKVELWYSTGSTNPTDFTMVKSWNVTNAAWTEYSTYVPETAKRIAIRHNFQGGILQVDDISLRRAGDTPENITLRGYNVYRNGEKLNDNLITSCTYTDSNVEKGTYEYAVNAVYDRGESNTVKVSTNVASVTGVADNNAQVFGGYGVIDVINADGMNISVITLDGKNLYNGVATPGIKLRVSAGVYLVKVGTRAFKVTVK